MVHRLEQLVCVQKTATIELCAYGFRRAFSWRCRSVEPLLELTFEPLHQAAVRQSIPKHSWQLLEGALPWVSPTEAWDTALRLRRAAAKKCVDLPVRPDSFISIVSSEELFLSLMDAVWGLWNGPRYMRSVKDWLDHVKDDSFAHPRKIVRKFVKERSKLW